MHYQRSIRLYAVEPHVRSRPRGRPGGAIVADASGHPPCAFRGLRPDRADRRGPASARHRRAGCAAAACPARGELADGAAGPSRPKRAAACAGDRAIPEDVRANTAAAVNAILASSLLGAMRRSPWPRASWRDAVRWLASCARPAIRRRRSTSGARRCCCFCPPRSRCTPTGGSPAWSRPSGWPITGADPVSRPTNSPRIRPGDAKLRKICRGPRGGAASGNRDALPILSKQDQAGHEGFLKWPTFFAIIPVMLGFRP